MSKMFNRMLVRYFCLSHILIGFPEVYFKITTCDINNVFVWAMMEFGRNFSSLKLWYINFFSTINTLLEIISFEFDLNSKNIRILNKKMKRDFHVSDKLTQNCLRSMVSPSFLFLHTSLNGRIRCSWVIILLDEAAAQICNIFN